MNPVNPPVSQVRQVKNGIESNPGAGVIPDRDPTDGICADKVFVT